MIKRDKPSWLNLVENIKAAKWVLEQLFFFFFFFIWIWIPPKQPWIIDPFGEGAKVSAFVFVSFLLYLMKKCVKALW